MDSLPVRNARALKRTKQYDYKALHKYIAELFVLHPTQSLPLKLQAIMFSVIDPDTESVWYWRFQPSFDKENEFILMLGLADKLIESDDWMLVRNPKPSASRLISMFGFSDLLESNDIILTDELFYIKDDMSAFSNFWEQIQLWGQN